MAFDFRIAGSLLALSLIIGAPAQAEERQLLGFARLFDNDVLGDGYDRWRTGSYAMSWIRGPEWQGDLPTRPGAIIEYRFRGEIVAPRSVTNPAPGDRLYAGILSAGAHLHFDWHGYDVSAGLDLVTIGEQTGLRGLQESIHDIFGLPATNVEAFQVDNAFFANGTLEIARDIAFAGGAVRPFVELQSGLETLARTGVDVTIGGFGQGGLRLRDVVTGQRMSGINGVDDLGWSFLLGGDIAHVDRSALLPSDRGYLIEDTRTRYRAGVNYAFGMSNLFYGVTYLSEEFVGQPEGQYVGSITLGLDF